MVLLRQLCKKPLVLLALVHLVVAGTTSRRVPTPPIDLLADPANNNNRHLQESFLGPGFKRTVVFNGTKSGAQFGTRVAMNADGTVVAAVGEGYVEVYELLEDSNQWKLRGGRITLTSDVTIPRSIDLSPDGRVVAFGQPELDHPIYGSRAGQVNIYEYNRTSNSWIARGIWVGTNPNDQVGFSLAFHKPVPTTLDDGQQQQYGNGDVLALGVPGFETVGDPGFEYPLGEVWLLFYNETSGQYALSEQVRAQSLTGPADTGRIDFLAFGSSLALTGLGEFVLAVGIDTFNTELRPGRVVVLVSAIDTGRDADFVLLGSEIVGEGGGDGFGQAIAMSQTGRVIAIGGPRNDGRNQFLSGHVEVYGYVQGNDEFWVQLGTDIDGLNTNEQFGFAMAISYSGDTLLVGAPFSTRDTGYAVLLKFDLDSESWEEVELNRNAGTLINGGGISRVGHGVAMSADGTKMIIGAPFATTALGVGSGTAQLWQNTLYPTFSPIFNDIPDVSRNEQEDLSVGGFSWLVSNVKQGWTLGVSYLQSVFGV
ncbi:Inherit from bactNOG: outer membrane autotransporter barrel [Seminavis robusta]|uniref:Inherit from bactNOG: outer membrane autotransporter barrel n=1 Tax=Seminavis robusta TaxID=568900 RepID=A0A9N8HM03_9STRA|nr:Inherit from bactNOG: outer membrane autotransporter barrel [Seminavis robusta]|eukprot:Sro1072_g238090.1 Inherit from bactNOG: outer membrane autotransporter barrel (538) ;mRNA; r:18549-20275